MEIKDIVGKKVAIWCDTEEKANDCVKRISDFFNGKYIKTFYQKYSNKTCYNIIEDGREFCDKKWYKDNNYFIISYNDFFGIFEQVKDDVEDEMSTVEIVEWLGNHYYDGTLYNIFGRDYNFDDLINTVGAEVLIKKINAYEREQRKAKVSDEEITLLLDEKYGVGKWVRK